MKWIATFGMALSLALVGCSESGTADAETTATIQAATNTVEAKVTGMDCSGCTGSVCGAVAQIAGVTAATADLETGKVTVALADDADAKAALKEIETTIAGLSNGKYTVNSIEVSTKEAAEDKTPEESETPKETADEQA